MKATNTGSMVPTPELPHTTLCPTRVLTSKVKQTKRDAALRPCLDGCGVHVVAPSVRCYSCTGDHDARLALGADAVDRPWYDPDHTGAADGFRR